MSDVKQTLTQEGWRFSFFQAVNLLERVYKDRPRVGFTGPYADEITHLFPNNSLGFPAADINRIEQETDENDQETWNIFQNFLGLYGPNAAAPIFIAESVNQCISPEDPLRSFLDIFNHRVVSLYYRAIKKSNFINTVSLSGDDPISRAIYAMMGKDADANDEHWVVPPKKLMKYCFMFTGNSQNAASLENLLTDFFKLDDVSIIQFVPRKTAFSKQGRGRLSAVENTAALGESLILGEIIEDITGQFLVRIRMPDLKTFKEFQPGKKKYKELVFLVNLYVQNRLNFSLQLLLNSDQTVSTQLSATQPESVMGQSCWVGKPQEEEISVLIQVDH